VRAHGEGLPGVATVLGAAVGQTVQVHLDASVRGVAPGQSVVLYDGTRVVGSATITATGRRSRA